MEILKKTGKKKLVFEVMVANRHGWYDEPGRVESVFGDFLGSVNHFDTGVLKWDGNTEADAILVKATAYTDTFSYGDEPREAGEGRYWYIKLNVRDLVNITQQVSVEPVVKLKEIEAEAS